MALKQLKVYYDGSCRVCAREMDYYRARDKQHALKFIDIASADFVPAEHGRSHEAFMTRLHVREGTGQFYTGIDAFAAIWRRLPGIHLDLLAGLVQLPGLHFLAALGYESFARLRIWLPKRDGACQDDQCRWGHPHGRK